MNIFTKTVATFGIGAMVLGGTGLSPALAQEQENLGEKLAGNILLQVESRGEAWYVDPETHERTFVYKANQAYQLMRERGLGITHADLAKIPVGQLDRSQDQTGGVLEEVIKNTEPKEDSDGDGYSDAEEVRNGYNPYGPGRPETDPAMAKRLAGKILLQVESLGEAWWVNPKDLKRYYLASGEDALQLLRAFGVGITTEKLQQIPVTNEVLHCDYDASCLTSAIRHGQPATARIDLALDFTSQEVDAHGVPLGDLKLTYPTKVEHMPATEDQEGRLVLEPYALSMAFGPLWDDSDSEMMEAWKKGYRNLFEEPVGYDLPCSFTDPVHLADRIPEWLEQRFLVGSSDTSKTAVASNVATMTSAYRYGGTISACTDIEKPSPWLEAPGSVLGAFDINKNL